MLAFSFGDHRDTERLDVRFTSKASVSVNDHRGVSVERREERKRRRKTICRIRQRNNSIGVAINNLYFADTREQVFICLLLCVSEWRNL